MVFQVAHGEFKGPLEVLLDLIEARKLHINDVSLSKVTDDFLGYARSHEGFPIAESAQFAFVASALLLIKSKSLLPNLSLTREEQGNIQDLERRLQLLQRFRELSRHVRDRFGKTRIYFPCERKVTPVFAPPKVFSLAMMVDVIHDVLAALPRAEVLTKKVVQKVISLEEMIDNLRERISSTLRMSFKEFAGNHKEKVNVIVGFLAMLELAKEGIIGVTQEEAHGDIIMETGDLSTPRY
ncbi:MAG: hypothetical protein COV91_05570 [Candidatus Taylorbacteria bacterium CG11_big_fil_rev_8_21_14_0_20_46_11]|uniref:Segregation and condensation protein A n=1 Tax=Candidatus Taylorbacteria bacterium CG11_big_fil_rev_8_21_14_0_20_46_11 TaxID=1975025 RepID=A0A2H0KAA0_9BACT|nr:MAG: hypothetical protein COV91_05570 [Candidatus Taylorbacteria bacterium CG11_big_fil_rev_8_21_14_0_20_46_11]